MRKGVKRKNLNTVVSASDECRAPLRCCNRFEPERELLVYTPAVFVRVASKGLTGYGTWKSVRRMEDRLVRSVREHNRQRHSDIEGVRRTAKRASPGTKTGMQKAHMGLRAS